MVFTFGLKEYMAAITRWSYKRGGRKAGFHCTFQEQDCKLATVLHVHRTLWTRQNITACWTESDSGLAWFSFQIFCLNNKIHFSPANANNSASFWKEKWFENDDFAHSQTTNKLVNEDTNNSARVSGHPRKPRGSQSGRVKRRDESFQAWAEEPLGTDSHRTISKRSRECWLLIGHKKCFVLLCPIGNACAWKLSLRVLSRPHWPPWVSEDGKRATS